MKNREILYILGALLIVAALIVAAWLTSRPSSPGSMGSPTPYFTPILQNPVTPAPDLVPGKIIYAPSPTLGNFQINQVVQYQKRSMEVNKVVADWKGFQPVDKLSSKLTMYLLVEIQFTNASDSSVVVTPSQFSFYSKGQQFVMGTVTRKLKGEYNQLNKDLVLEKNQSAVRNLIIELYPSRLQDLTMRFAAEPLHTEDKTPLFWNDKSSFIVQLRK